MSAYEHCGHIIVKETERKVRNHVETHAPFPVIRREWKAVGPSDVREGEKRSVPWNVGDKIPYWAHWLEYWEYTYEEE
jgi:hypothetical protein